MSRRVWHIVGWERDEILLQKDLPVGSLSEREVRVMLQRLYASTLPYDEIIRGSLRRNHRDYKPHFEVARGLYPFLTVGEASVAMEAKAIDLPSRYLGDFK